MWDFNKKGIRLKTQKLRDGADAKLYWLWPWNRTGFGSYYAEVDKNGKLYEQMPSYSRGVIDVSAIWYEERLEKAQPKPLEKLSEVNVVTFSLEEAILPYLTGSLPDGEYLVHIPATVESSKALWEARAKSSGETFNNSDCSVIDVSSYQGSIPELVSRSKKASPGRYLYIYTTDGRASHVGTSW